MVGVQFDQPGNDVIAPHVLARAGGLADLDDLAVAQQQRAVDDPVGEHDARIGENEFGGSGAGHGRHIYLKIWRAADSETR